MATSVPHPSESAWQRVIELESMENIRRQSSANDAADPLREGWRTAYKRQFASAWQHVAALPSGQMLRDAYAAKLTSPDTAVLKKGLDELSFDARACIIACRSEEALRHFHDAIKGVEAVLVACLGHYNARARGLAVRLLNALYDRVDWQLSEALTPVVSFVECPFTVDVFVIRQESSSFNGNDLRVLISAPSMGNVGGGADTMLTCHLPVVTEEEVWVAVQSDDAGVKSEPRYVKCNAFHVTLELAKFPRCGFFDWKVVAISSDGDAITVQFTEPLSPEEINRLTAAGLFPGGPTAALSPLASSIRTDSTGETLLQGGAAGKIAHGRFIVHKQGLREEQFHEIIVDLEGMKFNESGEIIRHGTFADLTAKLADLKGNGVSTLYVMGAIERDNAWGETDAATLGDSDLAPGAPHSHAREHTHESSAISVGESEGEGGNFDQFVAFERGAPAGGLLGGVAGLLSMVGGRLGINASNMQLAVADGSQALAADYPPGHRAYAGRPDANPHAVVDRHTPNRMLGGSIEIARLVGNARSMGINIMLQCDANVSASRAHRKYNHLLVRMLDAKGQSAVHAGTDCLENQWEDIQLLNYRKVETWDLLVSEMKTLVQNFGIGGLYLSEAQSYPLIMSLDMGELLRKDVDMENHYTPREILEGEIVLANSEIGYWSSKASRSYANPLLAKLARSLWAISPEFAIAGESHWGRAPALARSGVVPHSLDIISAFATTLGRFVDKNGHIQSVALPHDIGPVHYLKALVAGEADGVLPPQAAPQFASKYLHTRQFPNPLKSLLVGPAGPMPAGAQQLQVRSLSSSRMPYPALLLGCAAWPAIDCLYTLPGVPMLFQDEKFGKGYRVDVTGTYSYNEKYLEEERKRREKRVITEKHALKQRAVAPPRLPSHSPDASSAGTPMSPWNEPLDDHLGVGGVVPAMQMRGVQPSFKITRTGFSTVNLAGLLLSDDEPTADDKSSVSSAKPPQHSSGHPPPIPAQHVHAVALRSSAARMLPTGSSNTLSSLPNNDLSVDGGYYSPYAADETRSIPSSSPSGFYGHSATFKDEDDDQPEYQPVGSGAKLGSGFGFRVPDANKDHGSDVLPGTQSKDSDMTRVASWAAMDSMTFKGDAHGMQLRDSVRHMNAMEARLRTELGPAAGFDLLLIRGRYEHRRQVRMRYRILREGGLTVLNAQHRFGEHGHVFAFARSMPGQVAVVAANFNAHPSTFAVDCSALTTAFGAATTSDASASVAELMSSSVHLGELVQIEHESPVLFPSLNLKGGVWEVRNIFHSSHSIRSTDDSAEFSEADGPLVAILTSEEAAYAPILATLQKHDSHCWLYRAAAARRVMTTPTGELTVVVVDRDARTETPAMQWLFASSLLRLQSVLRLKECGLATAVIMKSEVEKAGSYSELLRTRNIGANEMWISPGEALKDAEIQAATRHNMVYALLRAVVRKTYKMLVAQKGVTPVKAIVQEVATLIEAALRVLVTHWQLVESDLPASANGATKLAARPLPALHGAMNKSGSTAEQQWYCIDADAAVIVSRAALFLAVKDIVAQAENVQSTDVSDNDATLSEVIVKALHWISRRPTVVGSTAPKEMANVEKVIRTFAQRLILTNDVAPIVFVTPELGKWSTVGGLGVMVDELSVGLADLGAEVICISPYYHVNRKGVSDYLRFDNICYAGRTIGVWVGGERIEMGVHEGRVKNVRLFFLHNASVFPRPYPDLDAYGQMRVLAAFAKGTLELLCQWQLIPNMVVTNDWFTGLVPAYARYGHFGDVFKKTDFMHIAHNLNPDYEGRLWPERAHGTLQHLHELPAHLLVDFGWSDVVVNPTRAALLSSDTWATVSRSYRQDLLGGSPMSPLLKLAPHPFAHPNGIPVIARVARIQSLPYPTHDQAKAALQQKYFGFSTPDLSMPLFAFVGRITMQKGVHLILQAVEEVMRIYDHRAMFLVGGMASTGDTYGNNCASVMRELHRKYRDRFWADPGLFFTDGDLVNIGADFCMMPSMFEPGGIVQQEFFVAGTPVIAYKTGGLKDTVVEFNAASRTGNGFVFEGYAVSDFVMAFRRAKGVFYDVELYNAIRTNARESVMDLAVVSKAWFREFHRVRRCLPPPVRKFVQKVPITFSIRVGDLPFLYENSVVEITGSFAGWKTKHAATRAGDDFEVRVELPPGVHQYKFIIDGKWTNAPKQPTIDDGTGNLNNRLTVVAPPAELDDE